MKKLILLLFPLMIFSQETTIIGDVDCNGEVNSEDASLILQFVTSVIDELPCEQNMNGLTPEQLQEIINMMNEQMSINYNGGEGGHYPIMVSLESVDSPSNFGEAMSYCYNLEENNYNDWYLPSIDQLIYAISGGVELPDEVSTEYIISSSLSSDYWQDNLLDAYIMLNLSDGSISISDSQLTNGAKIRCVRNGSGQVTTSSNSSSADSSIGGVNQPITMIGPMFWKDEYPDFLGMPLDSDNIYYSCCLRFCGELDYNGYSDWRLPTWHSLQNWIEKESEIIIPNYGNSTAWLGHSFWLRFSETIFSNYSSYILALYISGPDSEQIPNIAHYPTAYGVDSSTKCFCVR